MTVHSFIGVGTGQAPFDVLVSRALNNPLVKRRLQEVDYLPRIHHVVVFIPLQIWIHSGVLFEKPSVDKSFGMPNFTEFIDVCKLL